MEDKEIHQWADDNYSSFDDHGMYHNDVRLTRSGPDTRLTELQHNYLELEQQLEVAETRCGSLKSQLDYMKMLYHGIPPSPIELLEPIEQLTQGQPHSASKQSSRVAVKMLVDDCSTEDGQENSGAEDIKYYQFLKEIHKMQEITRKDADLPSIFPRQQSVTSSQMTPRFVQNNHTILQEEQESISAECRHTRTIRKTYTLLGSASDRTPELKSITTSMPTPEPTLQTSEVCRGDGVDDASVFHNPYQHFIEDSACLQDDLATARELTSWSISENKSASRGNGLIHHEKAIKKQELVLKLSESLNNGLTIKRKKNFKVDLKKQKIGSCIGSSVKKSLNSKYDDTLSVTSKCKKRKGKLRAAHSRNTVLTKENNLTDRRDSKKRKQKGSASATHVPHRFRVPMPSVPHTRTEVVEIYHNNTVDKGGSASISGSSSKHSKHEAHPKNNNVILKKDGLVQMNAVTKYQPQQKQQLHQLQQGPVSDKSGFQENVDARKSCQDLSESQQTQNDQDYCGDMAQCRSDPQPSRHYDPTITRNYEMPTVASKLKKVHRSYFSRFNFRNIPFVVSTSVSPSHNLGLNIQQVLSIMKTRQPMTTGITPLIIRKMSKGFTPVSTLLDRINDPFYSPKSPISSTLQKQNDNIVSGRPRTTTEYTASADETMTSNYPDCSNMQMRQMESIPNTQTSYDTQQLPTNPDKRRSKNSFLDNEEAILHETDSSQKQESGCVCCPKRSKIYNKMLKQYTSRRSMTGNPGLTASALLRKRQEEINIGDNQYNQTENVVGRAKGIREVLINLHDQFEELNISYEKLQEKAASSNDKSITKQALALEKELNAKEEEINAVVGLYKEVLYLKQQVNSVRDQKNSFVCITTSGNPSSPIMLPRTDQMRAELSSNPLQALGMRSKGLSTNAREPATATRLTGLLREIQSFQKQLLAL